MRHIFKLATIILFSSCLHQSCKKSGLCNDAKFTFDRQENNSNNKLNGYYYGNLSGNDPNKSQVYLFYENGIYYSKIISFDTKNIENDTHIPSVNKEIKAGWGIYKIENNVIEIQSWASSTSCNPVLIQKGEVVNDTTFRITLWNNSNSDETHKVSAIFSFHKYSPKPDSTNSFVP